MPRKIMRKGEEQVPTIEIADAKALALLAEFRSRGIAEYKYRDECQR